MTGRLLHPSSVLRSAHGYHKPRRPVLNLSHPLSRGLLGCWLLGDVGGVTIPDYGLFSHNASSVNGPLALEAGHHGRLATRLDGTVNSYIDCGNPPDFNLTGSFTVCGWSYIERVYSYARFYSKEDGSGFGVNNGFAVYVDGLGTQYYKFGVNKSGVHQIAISTTPFNGFDGKWHFLAATYDNVSGVGTIYVDGNPEGTFTATGALGASSSNFTIGAFPGAGGFNADGAHDGVRLYSWALSATDINWLYNEPYAGFYDAAFDLSVVGTVPLVPISITPPAGALTLTGSTPSVFQTSFTNTNFFPAAANLTITGGTIQTNGQGLNIGIDANDSVVVVTDGTVVDAILINVFPLSHSDPDIDLGAKSEGTSPPTTPPMP